MTLPEHRKVIDSNCWSHVYRHTDYDPIRSYHVAWYRQPDKIVAVLCTVGILAVTSAIFWGWL